MAAKKFCPEVFMALYNQGLSDTMIARRMKCTQPLISMRRKNMGLPPNHQVGANKGAAAGSPMFALKKPKVWNQVGEYYDAGLNHLVRVFEPGFSDGSIKTRGL